MMENGEEKKHPFYGHDIYANREQQHINKLLKKYRKHPVNDELRKKIWDELQMEKHLGRITIPFKIATRMDPCGRFPNFIEVILDTKV